MIKLENIEVCFNNQKILKNVFCTIDKGDVITIIGNNGAGKSTLFNVIAGKIKPDSGRVLFEGNDVTEMPEQMRARFIGRLFQNPQVGSIGSMSVRENLSLAMIKGRYSTLKGGLRHFPRATWARFRSWFGEQADMLLDKPLRSLSGGQRQLVAFIMATLVPPKLLLLDEPTAALDPKSAKRFFSFVANFVAKHEITTMFITHDHQLARWFGKKVWHMKEGEIVNDI